jgi:hypothetical protein
MAASWLLVALRVDNTAAVDLARACINDATIGTTGTPPTYLGKRAANGIIQQLQRVAAGVQQGNLYATVLDNSATFSTGNIACTRANAATDTITFTYGAKTVVLTEGATGENGFARGASDTTCAANLAACINTHSVLGPLITALGSSGNCGLTAKVPTALLQDIAMTTNDATAFSFTQLTSGTEGAAQFFVQHFPLNRTP